MNRNRCPWCGKKRGLKRWRKKAPKKIPRYFIFTYCQFCNHYYGQNPFMSKYFKFMLFLLVPVLLISFILEWGYLLLIYGVLLLPLPILLPLVRMDEEENCYDFDENLHFEAEVICASGSLKKNDFYFLSNSFDSLASYSIVSPIVLKYVDLKNGKINGNFLYAHQENEKYMNFSNVTLYNSKMAEVANIKFIINK